MPSLRARLVNRYVRGKLKYLPLPDIDSVKLRSMMEAGSIRLLPKSVARETISAPVRGEWQRPSNAAPGRTILYLHGGGYVFGSPRLMAPISCNLAAATRAPAFSLDYRLAPEHPCPAALDDALAAFDFLVSEGTPPHEIYVGGDSAGGGLALAMMQALKERGSDLPGGAFLLSPWTDLTASGASIRENDERDAMFTADSITRGGVKYAGTLPLDDPRVSPLYGRFEGLPRLYVCVSDAEVLRDDSIRMVEKARKAGVSVEFQIENGLVHIWPLFAPFMPESGRTIRKIAAFIRENQGAPL
ncbi:MAG: alpha/beta hydrolase [Pseudomonadota bacterium]